MKKNKKIKLKVLNIILSILIAIPFFATNVVRADGELNVVKDGDIETFIDNVPVEDITAFIDVTKIKKDNYTWESTIENVKQIEFNSSNILVIEKTLAAEEEYTPSGTLTLTFKDAFIDKDDTRHDLVLEISDLYIKQLNDNPDVYYYGIIVNGRQFTTEAFSQDLKAFKWGVAEDDPLYINRSQRTNRSANFKVYEKDGSDVKFAFGIKDLDVGEYPANGSESYEGEYIESIEAISGYGDVYMPNSNILKIEGNKMSATATDSDTWNTGYITLFSSNNESEWRASGTNTKTTLFETLPFHKVEDSVIGGGEIKYVKDNVETDQGLIITGGGDKVSIVTRPLEGHKIKKVTVDGEDVTPEDKLSEYTYNFDNIREDHEIIAEYEPFSYKINYDSNGGEGEMTSDTFVYTDEAMESKENTFTKQGQRFVGFKALDKDGNPIKDKDGNELPLFKSADDFKEYLIAMGDGAEITLQAQWETATYTIKYDANGGEGEMEDQHFTSEDKTAMSKDNEFTKEGHRFSGFRAKDKDGNYLKDENGEDIIYDSSNDFMEELSKQGDGGEITLVALWLPYTPPVRVEPVTVEKIWEDEAGNQIEWPEEIESINIKVIQVIEDTPGASEEVVLTAQEPSKTISFFNENVMNASYIIEEQSVEGYSSSYIFDNESNTVTITNIKEETVPTYFIDMISVSKYWNDDNNADGKRPEKLQLIIKDNEGNVYDGSDENHTGLLTKENVLNMEEILNEAKATYEAQKDTMSEKEKAETLSQLQTAEKEIENMKKEYGSAEYWFGMWFITYEGTEGRTYTVEEPEIDGYKLVKLESKGERGVQLFNLVNQRNITSWVDENGEELLPSKSGTLPTETIKDYVFVKTETLENGDIKHIYRKVETHFIDEEGKPLLLKEQGILSSKEIKGYELKESKNTEVGDMEHVYKKIVYPIKYVLDGGTNNSKNPSSYTIEDEIKILDPSKQGYVFKGWKEGNGIKKGSTGEKTFTAVWEKVNNNKNNNQSSAVSQSNPKNQTKVINTGAR